MTEINPTPASIEDRQGMGASSGEDRATAAEPVVSALRDGIPSADRREGRVVLGCLAQPLRNGSHEVAMGWEAVLRPVRVCEGGGWYTEHPTDRAWVLRTWMEHKGRPGYAFGPVSDERDTDLEAMIAARVRSKARNYGFAQRIEAGTDETRNEVRPEGREPGPKDAPEGNSHG